RCRQTSYCGVTDDFERGESCASTAATGTRVRRAASIRSTEIMWSKSARSRVLNEHSQMDQIVGIREGDTKLALWWFRLPSLPVRHSAVSSAAILLRSFSFPCVQCAKGEHAVRRRRRSD